MSARRQKAKNEDRSSASNFVRLQRSGSLDSPAFAFASLKLRRAPALLSSLRSAQAKLGGGAERDRTDDLKLAKLALSQLSYSPDQGSGISNQVSEHILIPDPWQLIPGLVGPGGVEPPTSRLSGVRSNHLSYEPVSEVRYQGSGIRKKPRSLSAHGRAQGTQKTITRSFLIPDPCLLMPDTGKGDVDGAESKCTPDWHAVVQVRR